MVRKRCKAVLLGFLAVFIFCACGTNQTESEAGGENIALSTQQSQDEGSAAKVLTQKDALDLTGDGKMDDSIKVEQLKEGGKDVALLTITLGTGLQGETKIFIPSNTFINIAAGKLKYDDRDSIVLEVTDMISNYGSSDIHVFHVEENREKFSIIEDLTVLDQMSDSENYEFYKTTFFELPSRLIMLVNEENLVTYVEKLGKNVITVIGHKDETDEEETYYIYWDGGMWRYRVKGSEEEVNIGFVDFLTDYEGYLDNVKLLEEFQNQDYDGDQKADRVYQYFLENGKKMYEIRFGNGERIEVGPFDDIYTWIKLYTADLTGDGKNEIIFCGEHMNSTAPDSIGSEIAVWIHDNKEYKKAILTPVGVEQEYSEGYPIYVEKMDEEYKVLITCAELDLEEIYTIPLEDRETFDAYYTNLANEKWLMNERAWRVTVDEEDGTLSLYESVFSRIACSVKIKLQWEKDGFKVIAAGIES